MAEETNEENALDSSIRDASFDDGLQDGNPLESAISDAPLDNGVRLSDGDVKRIAYEVREAVGVEQSVISKLEDSLKGYYHNSEIVRNLMPGLWDVETIGVYGVGFVNIAQRVIGVIPGVSAEDGVKGFGLFWSEFSDGGASPLMTYGGGKKVALGLDWKCEGTRPDWLADITNPGLVGENAGEPWVPGKGYTDR